MHVTLAAIRAGRPRTRFATTGGHRRERQQGLRKTPGPAFARGRADVRYEGSPLAAVRRATRTFSHRPPVAAAALSATRRSTGPAWYRAGSTRRTGPRSAAPWHD